MDMLSVYTVEEEDLIVQYAILRKEEHLRYLEEDIKHIELRSALIHKYFQRMSTKKKVEFILALIDSITLFTTFSQIFHLLPISRLKKHFYNLARLGHDTIYGRILLDHNRMLDESFLEETIETDLNWFSTLEDQTQATFIINLLRISGGNIKRRLYIPLYRRYIKRLGGFHYNSLAENEVPRLSTMTEMYLEEFEVEFSKSSSNLEVEKQRKKWEETLMKYQQELNNTAHSLYHYQSPKLPGIKSLSLHKISSARMGDSKLKTVDMIQLMPIWIVKKIFRYLDYKTLQKIQCVNNYWSYVSREVLTDMEAREDTDRTLKRWKDYIPADIFDTAVKDLQKKKFTQRRRAKIPVTLGCLAKELLPQQTEDVNTESLVNQVLNLEQNERGWLLTFPRIIEDTLSPLYLYQPCKFKDVGFKIDVDEDIEGLKSYLTFSLASTRSGIRFSVDQATMENW